MAIDKNELNKLRHPSEQHLFILAFIVSLLICILALPLVIFGPIFFIAPIILFLMWFSLKIFEARCMNNAVRVTHSSFSEVFDAIQECKQIFGYKGIIEAFVVQDGTYNAAIFPLLNRKYIILNSEIFISENSSKEIRFLIGRFVGALASRHYRLGWFQIILSSFERLAILNLLLTPYERAVQLSGDQMGLYIIKGDLHCAITALMKSILGPDIANRANVASFLNQERVGAGFFSWLTRSTSKFPHHTTRVANLINFAEFKYPLEAMKFRHTRIDPCLEATSTLEVK